MSPSLALDSSCPSPSLISKTFNAGSYIVSLAHTPSSSYAALSTNAEQGNSILIYSLAPSGLSRINSLSYPAKTMPTSLRVVQNFGGRRMLMSSHKDPGGIAVWDERAANGAPVVEISPPKNRAILSFDVSSDGATLAAGTDLQSDDASIFYWDPRNTSKPLHIHSSTHSDDITALHFHPTNPRILLSASTDGLLTTSDALEPDEDEAGQEVANWGCSIAKAGWYSTGNQGEYNIWASSDMETFGLWKENLDVIADLGDIRQPSLPNKWSTDYLVDVCDFPNHSGPLGTSGLTLFLGSNSGAVAIASTSHPSNPNQSWTIRGFLQGGHSDSVVRSVLWDSTNKVLLTGDEDGRLSAWRPASDSGDGNGDVEMEDDEPSNAGSKRRREDDAENTKRRRT